jgi:26S proteasome regulatory subunit N5
VCRCYQAVFEDKAILEDAARWAPVLKKICW